MRRLPYFIHYLCRIIEKVEKIRREGASMPQIDWDLYLSRLISKMHNGKVKIITGIRRCGKSYLLSHIFRNYLAQQGVDDAHIIEIALD